ncbi:glycosyltransferase family 2 protein [Benzoatithermus flavus]|uniref:Glycosyltransferase family 2 protein n=1 Tax=Benzoatithermus flavus TaxID=3108223 RepID=A0ABU8XV15_9PROT
MPLPSLPVIEPAIMRCDLSIIVPLYNEEENVHLLHAAICAAVQSLGLHTEIVFVDDGSRDRTFERCLALPRTDPTLRVIKFRRNAGQTAAMVAGIDHARGDILITMDGDLQNDPRDIPLFLEKIREGYDLVVGWRHDRQDHWSRVLPSKVANWLIGKVTGVPIKDNGCSLKAYRAELIKNIPLYNEMHRFIPAMASLAAPRIAQIKVRHHPRRFGKSKYGFSRIYKVFVDLLTIRTILSFSRRPGTWLGIVAGLAGGGSTICLLLSLWLLAMEPLRHSVVFTSISVLLGSLSIFALFLALLSQLIYGTAVKRFRPFLLMSVRAPETSTRPSLG